MRVFQLFFAISFILFDASADPSLSRVFSDPQSQCKVSASAGEYPVFTITANGKVIFSPSSDGIQNSSFSPSWKYVVLTNNGINGIDVEKDQFDFSMVIINCKSGKIKGFVKANCVSLPGETACFNTVSDVRWHKNETRLTFRFQPGLKKPTQASTQVIDFKNDPLP